MKLYRFLRPIHSIRLLVLEIAFTLHMPTYILGMAAVSMYIRKFTSIEFKLSTNEYLKLVVKSLATIWALKFQYKLFLN